MYKKLNNLSYINAFSNHPPNIVKCLSNSINDLLLRNSSSKEILTTPKKITKKYLANQAIKPNFYTKKVKITPTVKKVTAKTPQVKNKGNIR